MDDQPYHLEPATAANMARHDQYHAETIQNLRTAKAYICATLDRDGNFVYSIGGAVTHRVKELFFVEVAMRLSANLDQIMREQEARLADEENPLD